MLEQKEYDPQYCYEGTNVLINKLGIKDSEELERVSGIITTACIADLEKKPLKGSFDLSHYQRIHKAIFQDIFDWAGETRNVNISKSEGHLFCLAENIPYFAEDVFKNLRRALPSMREAVKTGDMDYVAEQFATFFGDLNALHPFREGNGRTERCFLRQLANELGLELDFDRISREEYLNASIKSMLCDYSDAKTMFKSTLAKQSIEKENRKPHNSEQKNKQINYGKDKSR